MVKVCPAGPVVKGIDVSSYQTNVDWNLLKSNGIEFAFIKASEGSYADPMFNTHVANAKAANIIPMAYHYFHPNMDPLIQAQKFCSIVPKGMRLAMDWETTDNVPVTADANVGFSFLSAVETMSATVPIIYSYPYFFDALSLDVRFKRYPLWISHFKTTCPLIPASWDNWLFWQTDGDVPVQGITGSLGDTDVFNGTLDQLKAFCNIAPSVDDKKAKWLEACGQFYDQSVGLLK